MNLSDTERLALRDEIFDHIAEAHVLLFQHNDNILPGWPQVAGLLRQAGGQVRPDRVGQLIDSPNIAIQRNKDAAKAAEKPISKAKSKAVAAKVEEVSVVDGAMREATKEDYIERAQGLGIKVDGRMKLETIKAKIAEHGA